MNRWLNLALCAFIGLIIIVMADNYYRNQIAEENEQRLERTTNTVENNIETAIRIRLIAIEDLQAFMLATDTLPEFTTFDRFAKELLEHYPIVRTVQFINTDLIIEHTYPLEGNEAAVGLDLSDHPTTHVALKAIEERTLVATNPITTAQGSLAIVARIALYQDDELLGLVAGVFDIDAILTEVLADMDDDLAIRLEDIDGQLFWGKNRFPDETRSMSMPIADNSWLLTVGWADEPPRPSRFTLGLIWGGGLALLVSLLFVINQGLTRYDWLNNKIHEKTHELEQNNQQLVTEIAERKLAEKELRLSHEILKQLPSAIVLTDTQGIILRWMGSAEETYGYTTEEAIGNSINIVRMPDLQEEYTEQIVSTIRTKGKFVAEMPYIHKDGHIIPIESNISALYDELGDISALIGVNRNISERKQTEYLKKEREHLEIQLEKEKELVDFRAQLISIIAHEFRTPLTVILASSSLLVDYEDRLTLENRHKRIRNIATQAERLGKMLDDIDILSKSQRGFLQYDPQLMNVVTFCEVLVDELGNMTQDNQKLVLQANGTFPLMSLDHELMRHALTNLISNGIKYSYEDSTITLELAQEEQYLVIRVRDEGIGIPPEDSDILFKPFQRAHNVGSIRGTGLGLSIVKDIVELHGGKISYASESDVGTVFSVRIPLQDSRTIAPSALNEEA